MHPDKFTSREFVRLPAAQVPVNVPTTEIRHPKTNYEMYKEVLAAMPFSSTIIKEISKNEQEFINLAALSRKRLVFMGKERSLVDPSVIEYEVLFIDAFERFLTAILLTLLQWNLYPVHDGDDDRVFTDRPTDDGVWLRKIEKIDRSLDLLHRATRSSIDVSAAFEIELVATHTTRIEIPESPLEQAVRAHLEAQGRGAQLPRTINETTQQFIETKSDVYIVGGSIDNQHLDTAGYGPLRWSEYSSYEDQYAFFGRIHPEEASHIRVRVAGNATTEVRYGVVRGSREFNDLMARRQAMGVEDPMDDLYPPGVFMMTGRPGRIGGIGAAGAVPFLTARGDEHEARVIRVFGDPTTNTHSSIDERVRVNRVRLNARSATFIPWFAEKITSRGTFAASGDGSMPELFKGLVETCVRLRRFGGRDRFPAIFDVVYRMCEEVKLDKDPKQYVHVCANQLELVKVCSVHKAGHLVEDIIEMHGDHIFKCLQNERESRVRDILGHMMHALLPVSVLRQRDLAIAKPETEWSAYVVQRLARGARISTIEFFRRALKSFKLLYEVDKSTIEGRDHRFLSGFTIKTRQRAFHEKLNLLSVPIRSVLVRALLDRLPYDAVVEIFECLFGPTMWETRRVDGDPYRIIHVPVLVDRHLVNYQKAIDGPSSLDDQDQDDQAAVREVMLYDDDEGEGEADERRQSDEEEMKTDSDAFWVQ